MPTREHLVLCGGARRSGQSDATALRLDLHGPSSNVTLRIQDLSARLVSNIPDTLVDLLEVAAYVYAADSAIGRGGKTDAQLGARWRRSLSFFVPVRRPNLWQSAAVSSALRDLLGFMSDDTYTFEFSQIDVRPKVQSYLEFSGEDIESFSPDEVVLFSGGIDSFAGAVERLAADGKSCALVSHRSATKIASTQTDLVASLRARFGRSRILHIPVLVNLDERLGRESTHRTRSFLFAALGAATARLFGLDRLSFFENGVVSMNLPLLAQVVGARATRTTHPQVLAGFRNLLSELFECPFSVANPFVWRTKAEIVEGISAHGCGDLIRDTRSCTRVRDMTRQHPHCGFAHSVSIGASQYSPQERPIMTLPKPTGSICLLAKGMLGQIVTWPSPMSARRPKSIGWRTIHSSRTTVRSAVSLPISRSQRVRWPSVSSVFFDGIQRASATSLTVRSPSMRVLCVKAPSRLPRCLPS
jgi:hypothetical protein